MIASYAFRILICASVALRQLWGYCRPKTRRFRYSTFGELAMIIAKVATDFVAEKNAAHNGPRAVHGPSLHPDRCFLANRLRVR